MSKRKRKRTPAEKKARRELKARTMMVFMNGRQVRVPRPQLIDGMSVDEFIARNADPIWLHQEELWHLMPSFDNFGSDPNVQERRWTCRDRVFGGLVEAS
ncbi:hypothetical protein ACYOEI_04080 [Singulisphaera rosea]